MAQGSGTKERGGFGTIAGAIGLSLLRDWRRRRQAGEGAGEGNLDPARGHRADVPAEIPAQGWKEVLKRVIGEIGNDHVLLVAAGVTFYAILALFPALAALVSVYGLFADPASIADHVAALEGVLPGGAVTLIGDQLESLASGSDAGHGLTFVIGLLASLWSANGGMKSIFEALNIAYEERETRGFVRKTLTSLAFTLGGLLFVIVAIGGVVAIPALIESLALGSLVETLLNWLRWPVMLAVIIGFIAVLYRYGPSRAPARWRWITWGSVSAGVFWLVLSVLFSWYVANFGSYNATYGSLGAAIGFMTWIWLSTVVIIAGAELNSELEHQTAQDTTTGPEAPMGQRGAVMADRTVGGPKRAAKRGDSL